VTVVGICTNTGDRLYVCCL